ncbi:hypothetical protein CALCODRAFT_295405 [Calocera cornea HHB12733]|uniref:Uncharacterized protein n=1 Tax=Calocera cornea HHB12733 TaxID=1353952 RepID=A0A165FP51_9BASI|nr:hypothetical protein CALCODRAFT_295405 [Calocera cornea HHB12733]
MCARYGRLEFLTQAVTTRNWLGFPPSPFFLPSPGHTPTVEPLYSHRPIFIFSLSTPPPPPPPSPPPPSPSHSLPHPTPTTPTLSPGARRPFRLPYPLRYHIMPAAPRRSRPQRATRQALAAAPYPAQAHPLREQIRQRPGSTRPRGILKEIEWWRVQVGQLQEDDEDAANAGDDEAASGGESEVGSQVNVSRIDDDVIERVFPLSPLGDAFGEYPLLDEVCRNTWLARYWLLTPALRQSPSSTLPTSSRPRLLPPRPRPRSWPPAR